MTSDTRKLLRLKPRHSALHVLRSCGSELAEPVDVRAVASRLGFTLIELPFNDGSDVLVSVHGRRRVLHINRSHAETWLRLATAKAIGFFVLLEEARHYRDFLSKTLSGHPLNKALLEFALHLLVPKQALNDRVITAARNREPLDMPAMADHFGIPLDLMALRLKDLFTVPEM